MNSPARDANAVFADACRLFATKAYVECEAACRQLLGATPNRLDAMVLLGDACAARGAIDAATEAYQKAQTLVPGHALPFTRLTCLEWRKHFGPPPTPRLTPPGAGRIQMTSLGTNGRFGNQLLQYGFLQLYARRHGLVAETPEWIGRYLYGFDDPVPHEPLPVLDERQTDLYATLHGTSGAAPREVNLLGYFCGDTSKWGSVADEFRALFEPVAGIRERLETALDRLRERGASLVAIHLRRGDFGYGRFWIAPSAWYRDWLEQIWPRLTRPTLYIATDDAEVASEFHDYNPVLGQDLEIGTDLPDFVLDHFILSRADYLAISNSSFSFSAAMLNATAKEFQRPNPNLRRLTPFAPWRAPVLLDPDVSAGALSVGESALLRSVILPGQTVVHIGTHCSDWTHAVRSEYPKVTVREIEQGASLDELRLQWGVVHINHARLEADASLTNVMEGAQQTFGCARIDMLHLAAGVSAQHEAASQLQKFGYRLFDIAESGSIGPVASGANPVSQVAIHERLLPLLARTGIRDLDLAALCSQHRLTVEGVVHVGAHEGRELVAYDTLGAKLVVFVEANPAVYARLVANTQQRSDVVNIHRAVSDRGGTVTLHVASFDQSSSLLPMHIHRAIYPDIVPAGTVEVKATPLDELLTEHEVDFGKLTLLCIDVQGVEHLVLRGARRVLDFVQGVQVEVNFAEMYRGGAAIEDIENLLNAAGFQRVALISGYHPTWGDAFYVRTSPAAAAAAHSPAAPF